jgi:hypothetical protein
MAEAVIQADIDFIDRQYRVVTDTRDLTLGLVYFALSQIFNLVSIGFIEILVREAGDAFAGSPVLVYVVCLAVVAWTYRWLQGRFNRVEAVPDARDNKSAY